MGQHPILLLLYLLKPKSFSTQLEFNMIENQGKQESETIIVITLNHLLYIFVELKKQGKQERSFR